MNILEVRELKKGYRSRGQSVEAVRGVSLELASGNILAFLGPNGAGKTTTIKMIAGLIVPDSGTVRIAGQDPHRNPWALKHVGAVLEGNRNVYWRLTPQENLSYFGMLKGLSAAEAGRRGLVLLERFGLADKGRALVQTLSRGMQQKLALAVALIHHPKLLLLDEPTLGLDVEAAENVKAMIRQVADDGQAVLLTTHQLEVAQKISDRVAILRQGEVVVAAPTQELLQRYSGDSYTILVTDAPDAARAQRLTAAGAAVTETTIVYSGDAPGLYHVLKLLEPIPLVSVTRDQADLTAIFLDLVREKTHA